jgi:hypothetical protein
MTSSHISPTRVDIDDIKVNDIIVVMSLIDERGSFTFTTGVVTHAANQAITLSDATLSIHELDERMAFRRIHNDIQFSHRDNPFVMYFRLSQNGNGSKKG